MKQIEIHGYNMYLWLQATVHKDEMFSMVTTLCTKLLPILLLSKHILKSQPNCKDWPDQGDSQGHEYFFVFVLCVEKTYGHLPCSCVDP